MPGNQTTKSGALARVVAVYVVALAVAVGVARVLPGRQPILVAGVADLAATVVVFGASYRFKNSSFYDPYWSVAPLVIAPYWLFAGAGFGESWIRQFLVLGLVVWWGVRLTWNWAQRWRGLDDEDWRYVGLQRTTGRLYWLVSFCGIHLVPTILVLLGCLPLFPVLAGPGHPPGVFDILATLMTAGAIWIEGRADRDLRRHRSTICGATKTLSNGIWAWSRHPNYFGEICFWWGLYLFGIAADPTWFRTAIGPIAITVLFAAYSIPAMEKRLRKSRLDWETYASRTSILVPRPPRG